MDVLSLFDGMSCGQIALERAGIHVNYYSASEIDKYASKVTGANYPWTVHLGDILNWRNWDIDWSSIELLIGGSPCQGFSFAGKGLAFDDPRSKLFFVFCDILNHIRKFNPDVKFLLENVKMKRNYLDLISAFLAVDPVCINSALVSAQNRIRYYWANWSFGQPEDKGIVLADILESGVTDRQKSFYLDASYYKGGNLKSYFEKHRRQLIFKLRKYSSRVAGVNINSEGLRPYRKEYGGAGLSEFGRILFKTAKKSGTVLSAQIPKIVKLDETDYSDRCKAQIRKNSKHPHENAVAVCSNGNMTGSGVNVITEDDVFFRKLTPTECERLQTVPDGYTAHVSNTQRYKMIGNGWNVDTIVHILLAGGFACN